METDSGRGMYGRTGERVRMEQWGDQATDAGGVICSLAGVLLPG